MKKKLNNSKKFDLKNKRILKVQDLYKKARII